MEINNLFDLNSLRSAPQLSKVQIKQLLEELEAKIIDADWITRGIMAPSNVDAIGALKSIYKKYSYVKFKDLESLNANGSVFLKGNQKTGNVFIRSENGLGEGILLTCQYDHESQDAITFGPLPLDFYTLLIFNLLLNHKYLM